MARSENSSSDDNFYSSKDQEVNQKKPQLEFSADEEELIIRMYNLVGERWSLIAGRIPGRTAEEIERYWKTRFSSTSGSKK